MVISSEDLISPEEEKTMLKEIPDFPKYYADEQGNIYSRKKGNNLRKLKPQFQKLWDYYSVKIIDKDGNKRNMTIHRLIALTYLPNPNNLEEVNHIDGVKTNNTLSNLEWVSRSENLKHAFRLGLNDSKGELNGRAKLKDDQVIAIYNTLLSGESNKDVAKEFNLNISVVMDIKAKRAWSHITKDLPDIEIDYRSKILDREVIEFICEKLQDGNAPTPVLKMCEEEFYEGVVRIDNIYDIKRRRNFKDIVKNYKW